MFGINCLYDDLDFWCLFEFVDNYWEVVYGSSYIDFMFFLKYFFNRVFKKFVFVIKEVLFVIKKMFLKNKEIYINGWVCNIVDGFIDVFEKEVMKEKENG